MAKLPPDGDDVSLQMIERAAALLLGGMSGGATAEEPVAVDEQVMIGTYSLSSNVERLQHLGVTAVLSVDAARPPLFELEMADVRTPASAFRSYHNCFVASFLCPLQLTVTT